MTQLKRNLGNAFKSGFLRSVSKSLVLIFLVFVLAVLLMVFLLFSENMKKNLVSNKQSEFESVKKNLTHRFAEFDSIVNDMYTSPDFLFASIPADRGQGYSMANETEQYLVGNEFISYLVYYRAANPDKFFSSKGELKAQNFWDAYVAFEGMTCDEFIGRITDSVRHNVLPIMSDKKGKQYLTIIEPVPLYSTHRLAFAVAYIEKSAIDAYVNPLMLDCKGKFTVYDLDGNTIYSHGNANEEDLSHSCITLTLDAGYNNWTYVLTIEKRGFFGRIYTMELLLVLAMLACVVLAVVVCLHIITVNFIPINQLAQSIADREGTDGEIIHEHDLLKKGFRNLVEEQERMYVELFFSNLMAGQYDEALMADAQEEYRIKLAGDCILPIAVLIGDGSEAETERERISSLTWECFNTEELVSYVYRRTSPAGFIVCVTGNTDDLLPEAQYRLFDSLKLIMKGQTGLSIHVGVGRPITSLHDFPAEAMKATTAAFMAAGQNAFFVNYEENDDRVFAQEASRFISRVGVLIRQGDTDGVMAQFTTFERAERYNTATPAYRNYVTYSLALQLMEYARHEDESAELGNVLDSLMMGKAMDPSGTVAKLRSIAVQLAERRRRNAEKARTEEPDKEQTDVLLCKIKAAIDEHLCDSMLSLEMLAEGCNVSPSYLSRYFKQRTDCTPMAYVENARMDIAKQLLATTDHSLDEILDMAGYIDKSNFIRKFKKREGMTPMAYRKTYRE